MRHRLDLPDEVKTAIREHLTKAIEHSLSGYESAHEDEDALTGELGSSLRSGIRKVIVPDVQAKIPGEWKWAIGERRVLAGVSFCVQPGEMKVILGGAGSGKSTILKLAILGTECSGTLVDIGAVIDEQTRAATVSFQVPHAGRARYSLVCKPTCV